MINPTTLNARDENNPKSDDVRVESVPGNFR